MAADEFTQIAKHFKSAAGFVSAIVTFTPLAGFQVPSMVPLWPTEAEVIAVCISLATVLAFLLYHKNSEIAVIRSTAKKQLVFAAVALAGYFVLCSTLTLELDGERKMKGFVFSQEAQDYLKSQRVSPVDYPNVFGHFGYDSAERIWSDYRVMRAAFAVLFCIPFATAASGFGLLVLEDFKRKISTASAAISRA